MLRLNLLRVPKTITVGMGGANTTFYETVQIDLGSGIAFQAEVGFTQGADPLVLGVLGQEGFFSRYNVEFRHRDREFLIEVP